MAELRQIDVCGTGRDDAGQVGGLGLDMRQLRNRDCHGCCALSNARLQFVGHVLAPSLGARTSQAPAPGNTQAKSTQRYEYTIRLLTRS